MLTRFLAVFTLVVLACSSFGQSPALGIPPTRSWALVIGASQYQGLAPLEYTGSDARLMKDTLVGSFGFSKDSVRLLAGDKGTPDQPSAERIRAEVKSILADQSLDQGDLFVFYFSGHGIASKSGDYLCPIDVDPNRVEDKGIPVKWLVEQFVSAGLRNVLIITDACRQGTKNPFGRELQTLGAKSNIAVFLACAPGTISHEDGRLKHGVFTYSLCKALKDATVANSDSGSVWASDVAAKVRTDVERRTAADYGDQKQIPSAWAERSQDVLLGVRWAKTSKFYESFAHEAKNLEGIDRRLVTKLLSKAAVEAANEGDYSKCVEMLTTVERLGQATTLEKITLGMCFLISGRESEALRVMKEISANAKPSVYRDMAIVYDRSPDFTPEQRGDAARRIWLTNKSSEGSESYLDDMSMSGVGTPKQKIQAKEDVFAALDPNDWIILHAHCEDLVKAEKWRELASSLGDELIAVEKPPLNRRRFIQTEEHVFALYRALGQHQKAIKVMNGALKLDPDNSFFKSAKIAMGLAPPDTDKADFLARWNSLKLPQARLNLFLEEGAYARDMLADAASMRREFPTSWEAALLELICLQAQDWTKVQPMDGFLSKAPDKDRALAQYGRVLLSILQYERLAERIDQQTYHSMVFTVRQRLGESIPDELVYPFLDASHWSSVAYVTAGHGESNDLIAAIYRHDHKTLSALADRSIDNQVRLALHLSCEGSFPDSEKLLEGLLAKASPNGIAQVTHIWNTYGLHGADSTKPLLKDFHGSTFLSEFIGTYIERLTWVDTNKPSEEPLFAEETQDLLTREADLWAVVGQGSVMPDYPDFVKKCVELSIKLRQRVKTPSLLSEKSGRALVDFLTLDVPFLDEVKLRVDGSHTDYTGKWIISGKFLSDLAQPIESKLEVIVDASGKATATLVTGANLEMFRGAVDDKGELRATSVKGTSVRCRLACDKDIKALPQWQSVPFRVWFATKEHHESMLITKQGLPRPNP